MTDARDHELMARALRLAQRGRLTTDPNPAVGCVLASDGRVIGEGWTAPAGGPHAEIAALAAAGSEARSATAYVTLEPCSHQGRTGPCTEALIDAAVARVVAPITDPNPLVAGRGFEQLRAAGIAVDVGVLEASAAELNRGYFSRMARGRPWVSLKVAASLDGRTALANGDSQWITGVAARRDVHRFRAHASAILTGVGTVIADDPQLTARPDEDLDFLEPVRVVVDSKLRMPSTARMLKEPGTTLIFCTVAARDRTDALVAAGATIETVEGKARCDLGAVLRRLAELEINELWVEAGSELSGAVLAAGLVDELVLYMAPDFLGAGARGMFDFAPLDSLDQRVKFALTDVRRLGPDLRVTARPVTVADP